jgi:hypothetical protein
MTFSVMCPEARAHAFKAARIPAGRRTFLRNTMRLHYPDLVELLKKGSAKSVEPGGWDFPVPLLSVPDRTTATTSSQERSIVGCVGQSDLQQAVAAPQKRGAVVPHPSQVFA